MGAQSRSPELQEGWRLAGGCLSAAPVPGRGAERCRAGGREPEPLVELGRASLEPALSLPAPTFPAQTTRGLLAAPTYLPVSLPWVHSRGPSPGPCWAEPCAATGRACGERPCRPRAGCCHGLCGTVWLAWARPPWGPPSVIRKTLGRRAFQHPSWDALRPSSAHTALSQALALGLPGGARSADRVGRGRRGHAGPERLPSRDRQALACCQVGGAPQH